MNVRRTKIVATLGPATATPEKVGELVAAGLEVARVNACHGTEPERAALIASARQAAEAARRPLAVLLDLQGPRIRVGVLPPNVRLIPGDTVAFAPESARPVPSVWARAAGSLAGIQVPRERFGDLPLRGSRIRK